MCLLKTCCCCCSLRTGSICAAILTIILGVLGLIPKLQEAINLSKDRKRSGSDEISEEEISAYIQMAFFALWIICSIVLLIGVCTRMRGCLIPWVIVTCIIIIIQIWVIVTAIIQMVDSNKKVTWNDCFALAQGIGAIICNIYLVMVVCSYHRRHMQDAVV